MQNQCFCQVNKWGFHKSWNDQTEGVRARREYKEVEKDQLKLKDASTLGKVAIFKSNPQTS